MREAGKTAFPLLVYVTGVHFEQKVNSHCQVITQRTSNGRGGKVESILTMASPMRLSSTVWVNLSSCNRTFCLLLFDANSTDSHVLWLNKLYGMLDS